MTVRYDIVKGGARFRKGEHVESRNSGRHGVIVKIVVPNQVFRVRWSGRIAADGSLLSSDNRRPLNMDEGDLYHLRRRRP